MREFYFTFGCGQVHEGCYHIIFAKNASEAREDMNRKFGPKWSMMYNSAEEAGVEEFNLRRIN